MNCHEAKELIDLRVHFEGEAFGSRDDVPGGAAMDDHEQRDWSGLDAHLACCPKCKADYEGLLGVRRLLADARDDGPSEEEVETMWTAIQAGLPADALAIPGPERRRPTWPLVAATLATAACLLLVFQLGSWHYRSYLKTKGGANGVALHQWGYLAERAGNDVRRYAQGDRVTRGGEELSTGVPLERGYTEAATNADEPPSARAFWMLMRAGENTPKQYVCPSSGEAGAVAVGVEWAEVRPDLLGTTAEWFGKRRWAENELAGRGRAFGAGQLGDVTSSETATVAETARGRVQVSDVDGDGVADADAVRGGAVVILGEPFTPLPAPASAADHGAVERVATLGQGEITEDVAQYPAKGVAADGHIAVTRSEQRGTAVGYPESTATGKEYGDADGDSERFGQFSVGESGTSDDEVRSDFSGIGHVSYGYQVPYGPDSPRPSEGLDTRMVIEADKGPYAAPAEEVRAGDFVADVKEVAPIQGVQEVTVARTELAAGRPVAGGEAIEGVPTVRQPEEAEQREAKSAQAAPVPRPAAKVIKTGDLGFEVDDYKAAVERVYAIVEQHGAFIADESTQEQTGGALSGHLAIRVAPDGFEGLFAALKSVGRLESESAKVADVTADYVDLEARIHTLQVTEKGLLELMQRKSFLDKITSLLEVERELTRVRSQIEQLQGQLRVMADRVGMSTITVRLHEPSRTVPSASLTVEVPVLADAGDSLGESLTNLGGRLLSGKTLKRDDGTLLGNYTLQVTLARFGELMAAVESLGRIESRQIQDRQFSDATAPWAEKVKCNVSLVLYERSRQLPQGTVRIEAAELSEAVAGFRPMLAECGGAIVSNRTTRRDDGSSVAELDLRVPAGRFAELIGRLDPLGRMMAKQVSGEAGTIVGGAADVLCQLSLTLGERPREVPSGGMILEIGTFDKARRRLSSLVQGKNVQVLASSSEQRTDGTSVGLFRLGIKAGDMETVVPELESLGRVVSRQLTGLGLGDLSQADPDSLGVIELTLAEKAAIAPEPNRASESVRNHLRNGLAGLYASLGLILYGVILLAPWAVIAVVVAWLVTRWVRKRRVAPVPAAAPAEPSKPSDKP